MSVLPPPPPPGWYPDPTPAPSYRWWSGGSWTAYTWPGGAQAAGAAQGPAGAQTAGVAQPYAATSAGSPRRTKWLGRWGGWLIVAGSALIWLWLFGLSLLISAVAPHAHDGAPAVLSPYLLVTGSGTAAAAIFYTMAYKLRPEDRLSVPRLVAVALLGGTTATLLVLPVEGFIDIAAGGTALHPSLAVLATAGFVEELVKMLCAVLLCLRLPVKNARIGLFVGGAVGLGFSVVENLSYLQQSFVLGHADGAGIGLFLTTTAGREISGPFLHPVFSALLGAAVFGAARGGRFRITFGVVAAYLGVAVAHGLFDALQWAASARAFGPATGLLTLLLSLVFVLASGLTWLFVVRRVRRQRAAAAAAASALTTG
ncbi:PrsW family glutamic-type intramembrane protease [Leifsonia shinshuensis]|uniref:PrsW family intramembrane metalloprotease n=1 Tax=Leifsonia shinshuensis TaxID=150026 RepID=A0A7G6YAH8_9MICO|nr:PrsW family glutamic-type intramembrane protease [Leifsonia shinshuensis]QNE35493.1 PrsW family intramembrane metalloprotease [Leifsonia shinshuensis]